MRTLPSRSWRRVRWSLHSARPSVREARRTDALTGLGSTREAFAALKRDVTREQAGALVFCELDHFRGFNNGNGHRLGDELLMLTAAVLALQAEDGARYGGDRRAYRIGGDEFLIRLPGKDAEAAWQLAEEARIRIKRLPDVLSAQVRESLPVTARFAVTGWREREAPPLETLIERIRRGVYSPAEPDSVTRLGIAPAPKRVVSHMVLVRAKATIKPILEVLADGEIHQDEAIQEAVATRLHFTDADRRLLMKNGMPFYKNRTAWGLVYIQDTTYLPDTEPWGEKTSGGSSTELYRITKAGLRALRAGLADDL